MRQKAVLPYATTCTCTYCGFICVRMTGVGGRPELIIEGTNNVDTEQWMVSVLLYFACSAIPLIRVTHMFGHICIQVNSR